MPIIDIKGVGLTRFPDGMSDKEIQSAIENDILPQFPELQAKGKRTWGETGKDVAASLGKGVAQIGQLPGQVGKLAGIYGPGEEETGLEGAARKLEAISEEAKSPAVCHSIGGESACELGAGGD